MSDDLSAAVERARSYVNSAERGYFIHTGVRLSYDLRLILAALGNPAAVTRAATAREGPPDVSDEVPGMNPIPSSTRLPRRAEKL